MARLRLHDTQHVKKDTNLALGMCPHVLSSKKKPDLDIHVIASLLQAVWTERVAYRYVTIFSNLLVKLTIEFPTGCVRNKLGDDEKDSGH